MRAVVRALEVGSNALLESPTGTGKTLCLLCAALGWRRHRAQEVSEARTSWEAQSDATVPLKTCPRIWYSSRTHGQLRQVMSELKRTSYKPASVILGSREHFCVHSSVSRHTGARQNAMCKRARDDCKCHFHVGFRKNGSKVSTALKDIEEIVSTCKEANVCPYYKVREDAKEAELLLIAYDYLIGSQTRESLQISLKNSILIFDEGHNIERSCEASASFELTQADIAGAITELDDAFELISEGTVNAAEALPDMAEDAFLKLMNAAKKHLMGLEDSVSVDKLAKDARTDRMMFKAPGSHILTILGRGSARGGGVAKEDFKNLSNAFKRAMSVLTYSMETASSGGLYLDKLQGLFSAAFKPEVTELDKNYQVLIYEEIGDSKKGSKRKAVDFFSDAAPREGDAVVRTLCLWCFSCSVAMRELQQHEVHSVIITSGTLSPLDSTAEAFGVPFPVVLENTHVIDTRKQLWGGVLTAGPAKITLDASFANRSEQGYLRDLGNTLKGIAACAPDGLLLAFSSYAQKNSILQAWRESGLLEEISNLKPLFEEPQGNAETKLVLERYNTALSKAPMPGRHVGGAILAAVCRGKLCEGIDFTDKQCRMVVMVGIPFPSKYDLRVVMKQSFLDARGSEGDGWRWYNREAIRAVNQTLGRVIRHRNDFGAVLLCDVRYASNRNRLSSWLKPQVAVQTSFEAAVSGCARFFGIVNSESVLAPPTSHGQPDRGSTSTPSGRASEGLGSLSGAGPGNPVGRIADNSSDLGVLGALWRGRKRPKAAEGLTEEALALASALRVVHSPATSSSAVAVRGVTGSQTAAARVPGDRVPTAPRPFIRGATAQKPIST
ncbi:unnamed protein product [Polarella glacialis]|nr:unnamed protein product [Polarella glacialis]